MMMLRELPTPLLCKCLLGAKKDPHLRVGVFFCESENRKVTSLKPTKEYKELVSLLKERGLTIKDEERALRQLTEISYYRLSGYSFQFLKGSSNRFRSGTSFDTIVEIYHFDQALRKIIFSALEKIEVYSRNQIAHNFSLKYGSDGHYDVENFTNDLYYNSFLETLDKQIEKNRSTPFVYHHIANYNRKMPLWCAVEILPFSALSRFYNNIKVEGKEVICKSIGLRKPEILGNWLHCFSVLRNLCAHYGRLYNLQLSPKINLEKKLLRTTYKGVYTDSLFAYALAMLRMMPSFKEEFKNELIALIDASLNSIEIGHLGFPDNWKDILLSTRTAI